MKANVDLRVVRIRGEAHYLIRPEPGQQLPAWYLAHFRTRLGEEACEIPQPASPPTLYIPWMLPDNPIPLLDAELSLLGRKESPIATCDTDRSPPAPTRNPLTIFGFEIWTPNSAILVLFLNDKTKAITAMINDKTVKTAEIQSGFIILGMVCCGLLFVGNAMLVWYGVNQWLSAITAASNVVSFCAFWAYLDNGSSNSSTNV